MTVFEALKAVTNGEILSASDAESVLGEIMDGEPSSLQIAALLGALRVRGETSEEILGFARAMRSRMIAVRADSTPLVDTCGTGGDASQSGLGTFNISTAASIVAAAAGVKIAKHGNRAVSSKSGSSDVLEALGVHLNLSPEAIARCIDEVGIGFMFAPSHHPALKNLAPIRRELGIRTIFNLLGPLSNPAGATHQVLGVPAPKWLMPMAQTLRELGCQRALVVHSRDGLDEFSTCAPTDWVELRDGNLKNGTFEPEIGQIACLDASKLAGGGAEQNATIISQILLDGVGPSADIVCLNAAAIFRVAGISEDWNEGIKLARATIASSAAREKLQQLKEFTELVG